MIMKCQSWYPYSSALNFVVIFLLILCSDALYATIQLHKFYVRINITIQSMTCNEIELNTIYVKKRGNTFFSSIENFPF